MRFMLPMLMVILSSPIAAQKAPKVDSIAVELAAAKDAASDKVVAAFTSVGLPVTSTSPNLIVSDLGESTSIGYGTNRMTVRAVVVSRDSGSVVVLRGEAVGASPATGTDRITNKQKGPYKKVWLKMEAVAEALRK